MKRVLVLGMLAAFALVLFGTSELSAQMKGKKEIVAWPSADIKWEDMKGHAPGIKYANLWGDIMKGAHGALIKLPAGLSNSLHAHSSDIKMVVVSGTFWIARQGEAPTKLGPGSYLHVPAGVRHTSGTADGEAHLFQQSPGKFDLVPVAAPPAKAK